MIWGTFVIAGIIGIVLGEIGNKYFEGEYHG